MRVSYPGVVQRSIAGDLAGGGHNIPASPPAGAGRPKSDFRHFCGGNEEMIPLIAHEFATMRRQWAALFPGVVDFGGN